MHMCGSVLLVIQPMLCDQLEALTRLVLHCSPQCHRWDLTVMAFVVSTSFVVLSFMVPISLVCSAQALRLSERTKRRSQVIALIEPATLYENMYSGIQAQERAVVFNAWRKTNGNTLKNTVELPRTLECFHVFVRAFVSCS